MPATSRRRPREILNALASLLVLVVLLVGIPLALHALWHPVWPPLTAPGIWHALTTPDQGQLLIAVLGVAGWAAWACFLLAVIVEIPAQIRRRPTVHLPALGWAQRGAGTLIASVFLAFAAPVVALAAPGPAHAATIATASVAARPASAHAQLEQTQGQTARPQSASATLATDSTSAVPGIPAGATYYTVEQKDNLWNIAAHCLGDGRKYPEIFNLNRGRVQPDGRALVEDDEIQPGWNLIMPAGALHCQVATAPTTPDTAQAQREYTVESGNTLSSIAQSEDGNAADWPSIWHANKDEISNPNLIFPGQVIVIPAQPGQTDAASTSTAPSSPSTTSTPTAGQSPAIGSGSTDSTTTPSTTASSPTTSAPSTGASSPNGAATRPSSSTPASSPASSSPQTTAPSPAASSATSAPDHTTLATAAHPAASPRDGERKLYEILGIGGLAAAAALGALGLRRRRQQHVRKTGEYIRMPGDGPTPTELEMLLRAGDDTAAGQWLDQVLRALAATAITEHLDLPDLRLISIGTDALYLQPAAPIAPIAPFTDVSDGWWVCPRDIALPSAEQLLDVPAPYPALVTVGHDEHERAILIDLESVRALALPGPVALGALRALALELLGQTTADLITVTLVGVGLELADASLPASINLAVDLEDGIGRLENWIRFAGEQLDGIGTSSVRAARLTQDADAPVAHILISAEEPTAAQADRLTALLQGAPAMCAAVVTGTPITVNGHTWVLPATGGPEPLAPTGISVSAQFLTDPTYAELIEHFRVSGQNESTPDPGWSAPPAEPEHAEPDEESADGFDEDGFGLGPLAAQQSTGFTGLRPAAAPAAEDDWHPVLDWLREDDAEGRGTPALGAEAAPGEQHSAPAGLGDGPQILLLGSIEMAGARGAVEDGRESVPLELAAYMVLNPGRRTPEVTTSLWPKGTRTENRNNVTSRLRAWLGVDGGGAPYFPPAHRGYRLHEGVGCDLLQFRALYVRGTEALAQGRTQAAAGLLQDALGLVRGRPFADAPPQRYGWAENDLQRTLAEIADAAEKLATLRIEQDDWNGAARAATLGMVTGVSTFEALFRIRFEAAYRARDTEEMERLAAVLQTQLEELGIPMDESTRMLMLELLERHPVHK